MKYNFKNKNINIPDKELENLMKHLEVDKEEAIEIWLEDEGYLDNEEQEALEQKAKDNRITATIHQAKGERKKKDYVRKEDTVKEELIAAFTEFLKGYNGINNVKVVNVGKIVEFDYGNDSYKIDLIRKRKPKNK